VETKGRKAVRGDGERKNKKQTLRMQEVGTKAPIYKGDPQEISPWEAGGLPKRPKKKKRGGWGTQRVEKKEGNGSQNLKETGTWKKKQGELSAGGICKEQPGPEQTTTNKKTKTKENRHKKKPPNTKKPQKNQTKTKRWPKGGKITSDLLFLEGTLVIRKKILETYQRGAGLQKRGEGQKRTEEGMWGRRGSSERRVDGGERRKKSVDERVESKGPFCLRRKKNKDGWRGMKSLRGKNTTEGTPRTGKDGATTYLSRKTKGWERE